MKRVNELKRRASRERSAFGFAAFVVAIGLLLSSALLARAQETIHPPDRYRIQLKLDFDALAYTGSEIVTWTNRDDRPATVLYFHLYPNLRADEAITGT